MSRLEVVDSPTPVASGDDSGFQRELHQMRDSRSGQIQKVADTGAAAPADAKADEPTTRAGKLTAEAAKAWSDSQAAKTDPADAIKTVGPKFEAAVKASDDDYNAAVTSVRGELKKLQPEMEAAQKGIETANGKIQDIFENKVPEDQAKPMQAAAKEYLSWDKRVEAKTKASDDLNKNHPDMVKDLDKFAAVLADVKGRHLEGKDAKDPDVVKAKADIQAASKPIIDAIKKLPEKDQQAVAQEAQAYVSIDVSDAHKAAIAKTLGSVDGLTASLDDLQKAQKAAVPVEKKLEPLEEQMGAAISDRIASRAAYSEALKAAGEDKKADELGTQAMTMMMQAQFGGVLPPLEDPKKPDGK